MSSPVQNSFIQSVAITPQPQTPAHSSATTADKLLPEVLAAGPLDAAKLAAFLALNAADQRRAAREERARDEQSQAAFERAQVADLHDKATAAFRGALIGGGLKVAGGVLQVKGGAKELQAGHDQAQAERLKDAGDNAGATAWKDRASAESAEAKKLDGFGMGAGGVGDIAKGCFDKQAGDLDADATEAEHEANRASRRADAAEDFAKEQNDFISRVMSFYEAYTGAANGATSAALLRA